MEPDRDESWDEEAARLLFVRDRPGRADLALVFGHSTAALSALRATHAAALYRGGYCPLVLLSGGGEATPSGVPEGEYMAGLVQALGVPPGAILVEPQSRTTFENAAHALELLRDHGLLRDPLTILLVSCPWHMGRVVLTVRQAFPAGTRLLACPHEGLGTATHWRSDPECIAAVSNEYSLLTRMIATGVLPAP